MDRINNNNGKEKRSARRCVPKRKSGGNGMTDKMENAVRLADGAVLLCVANECSASVFLLAVDEKTYEIIDAMSESELGEAMPSIEPAVAHEEEEAMIVEAIASIASSSGVFAPSVRAVSVKEHWYDGGWKQ